MTNHQIFVEPEADGIGPNPAEAARHRRGTARPARAATRLPPGAPRHPGSGPYSAAVRTARPRTSSPSSSSAVAAATASTARSNTSRL